MVLSLAAFSMHTSQYNDGENRSGSRSGRTLRRSSSSAGRPPHESSIAKNYFEIELDREELFPIELDMDWRGPPGQRKSPKCQSPETELEHVCQSARRDCRVSTNWIGAQRRVPRIRLHHHQEVWSRCTVQLRAHICELWLPTERGNMAAHRGQSGHQAHINELCLSVERGIVMDTEKEAQKTVEVSLSQYFDPVIHMA